jgi:hypothetical protein
MRAVTDRAYRSRLMAVLIVVFLTVDVAVEAIQLSVKPFTFSRGKTSIGSKMSLVSPYFALFGFEPTGFSAG